MLCVAKVGDGSNNVPVTRFHSVPGFHFVYDPSPGILLKNKPSILTQESVHASSCDELLWSPSNSEASFTSHRLTIGLTNDCTSFPFKFVRLSELTCLDCLLGSASFALRIESRKWLSCNADDAGDLLCVQFIVVQWNRLPRGYCNLYAE